MSAACVTPAGEDLNLNQLRAELLSKPRFVLHLKDIVAEALVIPQLTVVVKAKPPASGDVHDYVSSGPYWWPDPKQPDGLPYLRRDGETNHASAGDRPKLEKLQAAVSLLTIMSQVEDSSDYARAAARLLRTWFLDPRTRMNPHLRFAQGIPGICDGRGIGIIDTWGLCFLVEEVRRLEIGEAWTSEDLAGLKEWFSSYVDWLINSQEGRQECAETNNHGTWYDAQVVAFASFCGKEEVARDQIGKYSLSRIDQQFLVDGRQPHELPRTLSMTYCTFNLLAFASLAKVAARLGINLWSWKSPQGCTIAQGINWMLPYWLQEKPWTWPQIAPFRKSRAALLLEMAGEGVCDPVFSHAARSVSSHPLERFSAWEFSPTF